MAIPAATDLDALTLPNGHPLSEPGRRLAQALRDYGIYVVDGVGCGTAAIRTDQHVRNDVRLELIEDTRALDPLMRMVLNNSKERATAGGGTPLAPNTAIDR